MLKPFIRPEQLIKDETSAYLVLDRPNPLYYWGLLSLALAGLTGVATFMLSIGLIGWLVTIVYGGFALMLVTSHCSIIIDLAQQTLFFTNHYLFFEHQTRFFHFDKIDKVYLDFETHLHQSTFMPRNYTRRQWFIFVTLYDGRTVTLARYRADYPIDQEPNLHNETQVWERLAKKIAAATGKLLITTATVPGRAPRTFVDVIDQIVQRRLNALPDGDPLSRQTIRLRSHPSGHMEIMVNGVTHHTLDELSDAKVRQLIQHAIDEWHEPKRLWSS
ncbi:MAG TPA: hypothetical protein P5526_06245 [Anaerolineae bacterium]|nr:hypothetical protein [Anaerolineae bacterium]MCB0178568.1 hypothetical protein [Anaerolineae bacterium]MCB0224159.1 hypothetical protein [Anaerolineae bacterium]MCB9102793.1 hypothetical protein [Anaerolineales bacterium]HRV91744.1 hypothetical protein [Anaerolineae bacterium]